MQYTLQLFQKSDHASLFGRNENAKKRKKNHLFVRHEIFNTIYLHKRKITSKNEQYLPQHSRKLLSKSLGSWLICN